MFRCGICKQLVDYGLPAIPVVVERRDKTYPSRTYVLRGTSIVDPGGVGWEIAREVAACAPCATRANAPPDPEPPVPEPEPVSDALH